jgi:hypothetical protein
LDPFPVQTVASQSVVGAQFNSYTAAKSVINATDLTPIPQNFLKLGRRLRIRAAGALSNTAAAATCVAQVMIGTTAVYTTGNVQMSTTANTLLPFELEVNMRLDSVGSGTAAKFLGMAKGGGIQLQLGAGVANGTVTDSFLTLPTTAPAVGAGFDSTVASFLDFWWGFGTSAAGNLVQLFDYHVEVLA